MFMVIQGIEYSVVAETAMTDAMKQEAGSILPPEWVAGDEDILRRGWGQKMGS
jgi:hypothetical protein